MPKNSFAAIILYSFLFSTTIVQSDPLNKTLNSEQNESGQTEFSEAHAVNVLIASIAFVITFVVILTAILFAFFCLINR